METLPEENSGPGTKPLGEGNDAVGSLAVDGIGRTFLCNPLHDYESVWWTAIWYVFCCQPDGVASRTMKEARDSVYKDRGVTFGFGVIEDFCASLPTILQPLGKVLVSTRGILIDAYRLFEGSFDGRRMLLVFREVKECLKRLAGAARGLDAHVKPPPAGWKLDRLDAGGVRWFGVITVEERDRQAVEQEGSDQGDN